jgi:hypothetical protein
MESASDFLSGRAVSKAGSVIDIGYLGNLACLLRIGR